MTTEGTPSVSWFFKDVGLCGKITSNLRALTITLFCFFSTSQIYAQVGDPIFKRINEEFPQTDGLVESIVRDSRGYVWFGGIYKLQRFDGITIKEYEIKRYDSEGTSSGGGSIIYEDSDENLWVFCNGLILLYDPLYDDFQYLKLELLGAEDLIPKVVAVNEDKQKRLWIGFDGDLQSLLIQIPIPTLLDKVNSNQDHDNPIPISADHFDQFPIGPTGVKYHNKFVFHIVDILTDRKGDTWINREGWIERYVENEETGIGYFVKYLESFDEEGFVLNSFERKVIVDGIPEGVNIRIFLDKNENIWATTANKLYQIQDKQSDQIIDKDSIIDFSFFNQSLYTDLRNNLKTDKQDKWINCYDLGQNLNYSGALVLGDLNQLWLFPRNGKSIDIYSVVNTVNDHVEFEQIKQFNKNISDNQSWNNSLCYENFLDNEGILWIADRNIFNLKSNGVITLNVRNMNMFRRLSPYADDPSSIPNPLSQFHQDYKGNLWQFPSPGRSLLYCSNPELNSHEEVKIPTELPFELLLDPQEDKYHNLWFKGSTIHLINLPSYYSKENNDTWHHEFGIEDFDTQLEEGDTLRIVDMVLDHSQRLWVYVTIRNRNKANKDQRIIGELFYFDLNNLEPFNTNKVKEIKFRKFVFDEADSIHFGVTEKIMQDFWGLKPAFIRGKEATYLVTATALIRLPSTSNNYEVFYTGNKNPEKQFTRICSFTLIIDESIQDSLKVYGMHYSDGWSMVDNYLKCLIFSDRKGANKLESIHDHNLDDRFPDFPSPPLMDANNNIWFMGDFDGLFCYDPVEDNMKAYYNEYVRPKMLGMGPSVDNEGNMYFITVESVHIFNPNKVKQNPFISPINISDIKIRGKSIVREKDSTLLSTIRSDSKLILPYKKNMVSFSFNSTSLMNASQNLYKYKLEGWDDQWIETDALNRTSSYSNLSPGTYIFNVMGSNNDRIWNNKATSIEIIIQKPWWLTWGAFVLYFMVASAFLFGLIRFFLIRQNLKNKIQLEKIQLAKMQDVDTLKSRFFANVSHEFRTPLTLILGPLKQMLDTETDPGTKSKLSMIARNSRKLLFLVNQLLDFAKLKTGRLVLQAEETDLVAFIKRRFASFESLAQSRDVDYQFQSDTNKLSMYLDKEKLEKVIVNLLSNAFKFTSDGNAIYLKVHKNVSNLDVDTGYGVVEILVKDKGIGIDPNELDNIFNRYYQIPNAGSTGLAGSGIGLTMVKELVELHHGLVQVKSKKGKGTTFRIHLPLGKDHLEESELILKDDPIPELIYDETYSRPVIDESLKEELFQVDSKAHLLVVDDNTDMRNYLKEILQDDFIIEEAINGLEGITRAIEQDPDLIISDIMMPEMDGTELCQKLKSDERISHIPVVILTARAGKSDRLKGFEIGADEYITKPFSPTELRIRVQNLIEQRKILRERFRKDITLQPRDIAITSTDERFLQKAMKILKKFSVNDEFGTDQFSKEIGLSRSQLYRKLKALTDQSTSEFIRSYRLNHARQLLEANFGNVADVSYEAGFSSPSYFTECFKAQFGVLPSDYTNNNSKDSKE